MLSSEILTCKDLHDLVAGTSVDRFPLGWLSRRCSCKRCNVIIGFIRSIGRAASSSLRGVLIRDKYRLSSLELKRAVIFWWEIRRAAFRRGGNEVPTREHARALGVLRNEDRSTARTQVVEGACLIVNIIIVLLCIVVVIWRSVPAAARFLLSSLEFLGFEVRFL